MMRLKRPREKNDAHLDFVRALPCCVCGDNTATEAAHLRIGNLDYGKRHTGFQEKPHDMWALPLCGRCHREQHRGKELNFWSNFGVNPFVLCLSLYASSGDYEMAITILERQGNHERSGPQFSPAVEVNH